MRRKERQPQEFSRNALFRPFRMLAPNPFSGELPRKQTHLKRQQEALLSRHCPQNL